MSWFCNGPKDFQRQFPVGSRIRLIDRSGRTPKYWYTRILRYDDIDTQRVSIDCEYTRRNNCEIFWEMDELIRASITLAEDQEEESMEIKDNEIARLADELVNIMTL